MGIGFPSHCPMPLCMARFLHLASICESPLIHIYRQDTVSNAAVELLLCQANEIFMNGPGQ